MAVIYPGHDVLIGMDARNETDKTRARSALMNAVKNGTLIPSYKCQLCGKTNCSIDAHHDDYSKPLSVIWLCKTCHKRTHMMYQDLQRSMELHLSCRTWGVREYRSIMWHPSAREIVSTLERVGKLKHKINLMNHSMNKTYFNYLMD